MPQVPISQITYRVAGGVPLTAAQEDLNISTLVDSINGLWSVLGVSLNADGTLKAGSINNANVFGNHVIPESALEAGIVQITSGDLKLTADGVTNYSHVVDQGWQDCDGTAVSRTTFAVLFGVIGTVFGAGDGSTTFNLPDLRGRVVVCQGVGSGLTARSIGQSFGEETHLLTTTEIPSHTHPFKLTTANAYTGNPTASIPGSGSASPTQFSYPNGSQTTDGVQNAGGGGSHNNMQPSFVLRYLIKN